MKRYLAEFHLNTTSHRKGLPLPPLHCGTPSTLIRNQELERRAGTLPPGHPPHLQLRHVRPQTGRWPRQGIHLLCSGFPVPPSPHTLAHSQHDCHQLQEGGSPVSWLHSQDARTAGSGSGQAHPCVTAGERGCKTRVVVAAYKQGWWAAGRASPRLPCHPLPTRRNRLDGRWQIKPDWF